MPQPVPVEQHDVAALLLEQVFAPEIGQQPRNADSSDRQQIGHFGTAHLQRLTR